MDGQRVASFISAANAADAEDERTRDSAQAFILKVQSSLDGWQVRGAGVAHWSVRQQRLTRRFRLPTRSYKSQAYPCKSTTMQRARCGEGGAQERHARRN
jgi:hypothetical protein